MSRRLGIAGLQMLKAQDADEENLKRFSQLVRRTKSRYPWVDLVFVGELYLQPYGKDDWKSRAGSIPNDLTYRMAELARETRCWLVPGSFLEKEGERVYNTAVVFNPDGDMIAKYRKLFPWVPYEDTAYGTEFVCFDIPGIARIGLTICYDVWFPEVFRTLAWMGAEVILQPSATYTPDRGVELVMTQAQAIMNQCYVLNANVIMPQGGGNSLFVDPEGNVMQQAGTHEEVMLHVVDIERVHWIREHGTYAICPIWKSLRDSPLRGRFPVYENLEGGVVFKGLKDTRVHRSIRE